MRKTTRAWVKKAEAEAESKALQGQGIANERKAIIEGLQASIEQFQKVVEGASAQEVMQLVMVTLLLLWIFIPPPQSAPP